MKVLTDTHTLVWGLSDPDSLSPKARTVLSEAHVIASVANLWELLLKIRKKDALLTDPLTWWEKYVNGSGIQTMAIRVGHVTALGRLPDIHKDPFDRILVAQAMVENVALVTKDAHLSSYGVPVIW